MTFYETCAKDHPDFAEFLPAFMGTLALSTPEQKAALANPDATSFNTALQAQEGTAEKLDVNDPGPLHGKALATEQAIVLENVASGFHKPNVLDVKLGARLWDDKAPEAKRQRLDKVASETTSGSLGFRIAGMRVWKPHQGEAGEYKVYDKIYGRNFSKDNVKTAFQEFFYDESDLGKKLKWARDLVVQRCLTEVSDVEAILKKQESRMYSASVLFVYEGDDEALDAAIKEDANPKAPAEGDEDEDEDFPPPICAVKLIDFAHAKFVPGEGPDQNALQGVNSTRKILEELLG